MGTYSKLCDWCGLRQQGASIAKSAGIDTAGIAREALPCRNEVTQNSPDIQVSGLFGLTEHTYGEYLYRSAPLYRCICSTK